MSVMRRSRVAVPVLAAALAALLAAGAYAYWSGGGSGAASAQVSTPAPVTVGSATPTGALYPGASVGVRLKVTNANPYPVHVSGFALDTGRGEGGFAVDGAHAGCPVSALGFVAGAPAGGWTVARKEGSAEGELTLEPGVLTMGASAPSACQGASFTVYLKAPAE